MTKILYNEKNPTALSFYSLIQKDAWLTADENLFRLMGYED
ncbi:MAG: hypothetical protein R3E32_00430 [Chitinophagales bacterium]